MTRSAEAAAVLRVVGVEADCFELAARVRIVVGIAGRSLLADDAEPIAGEDLGTERTLVDTVIPATAGSAATTVGGTLMVGAPGLGALEEDRASGDRAKLLH